MQFHHIILLGTAVFVGNAYASEHHAVGSTCFSHCYTHEIDKSSITHDMHEYVWHQRCNFPFNEFLVSWNAKRPKSGNYYISIRWLHDDEWTQWITVAEWGAEVQRSFPDEHVGDIGHDVDTCTLKKQPVAFEVKVLTQGNAKLANVDSLFVNAADLHLFEVHNDEHIQQLPSVEIRGVSQQSQLTAGHPEPRSICSITSSTNVLNYLMKHHKHGHVNGDGSIKLSTKLYDYDPHHKQNSFTSIDTFSHHAKDQYLEQQGHKYVYGNWALNVAAVYDVSGGVVNAHLQRLNSFTELHEQLKKHIPVVVSIRGDLPGSPYGSTGGHLMTVVGWDQATQKVICVDPAFNDNEKTHVRYALGDFLKVWGNRKNVSYVFAFKG